MRLAMPSAMPAELAERMSDVPDEIQAPDFSNLDDCRAVITDRALAEALCQIAQCKGCSAEEYERARNLVERAMHGLWGDL
jgi:hypothetical protein